MKFAEKKLKSILSVWLTWLISVASLSWIFLEKSYALDFPELADCGKDYFTQNNCDQCFNWWSVSNWEKIKWWAVISDDWINPDDYEKVIYENEQEKPELKPLWEWTSWNENPSNRDSFWRFSNDIIWVNWDKWNEFRLPWKNTVSFVESNVWSAYTLSSTTAPVWDPLWLLKFTLNYHWVRDWVEWELRSHTECVVFYNNTAPENPEVTVWKTPWNPTTVKTWTEEILLLVFAWLIWLLIVAVRRKKSV